VSPNSLRTAKGGRPVRRVSLPSRDAQGGFTREEDPWSLSGHALTAVGTEMDAIAAVVIGGTLLTGGYGFVLGSALGVLVLGLIQTIISFEGTLSSWWTKIFIGGLLLVFIILQKVLTSRRT